MSDDGKDIIREYTLDQIPEGEHLRVWERHEWSGQEELFAKEYLRTGDRVKAYVTSHDTRNLMRQQVYYKARAILFQPWMQDYIQFVQEERKAWMKRGADEVLNELSYLARSNMADFTTVDQFGTPQFDLSGLTREQSAAIQELQIDTYMVGRGEGAQEVRSIKMKLAPKTPALELIGKNQKLFTDVLAHEGLGDEVDELRRARERARLRAQEREDDSDDGRDEGDGQPDAE